MLIGAALVMASLSSAALDKAAIKAACVDKMEQLAQRMLPQEKLNRALGFFGPVTKKYLPVFNQFQKEYNVAEKKLPVILVDTPLKDKDYDVVLCDVPCSGLGLMSRKPDIRQTITYERIEELLPKQKKYRIMQMTPITVGEKQRQEKKT